MKNNFAHVDETIKTNRLRSLLANTGFPLKEGQIDSLCVQCNLRFCTINQLSEHVDLCCFDAVETRNVKSSCVTHLNLCDSVENNVTRIKMTLANWRPINGCNPSWNVHNSSNGSTNNGGCGGNANDMSQTCPHYNLKCIRCEYCLPTVSLFKLHLPFCRLIKTGLLNICLICKGGFQSLADLKSHMFSHNLLTPYQPKMYGKSYYGSYGYCLDDEFSPIISSNDDHIKQVFNFKLEPIAADDFARTDSISETSAANTHQSVSLMFACHVCSKWFVSFYFLLAHCDICREPTHLPSSASKHSEQDQQTSCIYYCGICCYSFNSSAKLYRHMQDDVNAEEVSEVTCYQTGPSLTSIKQVLKYKLQVLGFENKKRYKKTCIPIKYCYSYLPQGVKPPYTYLCNVCNFAFEDQLHLSLHQQFCIETFLICIYKPFCVCVTCHRAFDQLSSLKKHMDLHKQMLHTSSDSVSTTSSKGSLYQTEFHVDVQPDYKPTFNFYTGLKRPYVVEAAKDTSSLGFNQDYAQLLANADDGFDVGYGSVGSSGGSFNGGNQQSKERVVNEDKSETTLTAPVLFKRLTVCPSVTKPKCEPPVTMPINPRLVPNCAKIDYNIKSPLFTDSVLVSCPNDDNGASKIFEETTRSVKNYQVPNLGPSKRLNFDNSALWQGHCDLGFLDGDNFNGAADDDDGFVCDESFIVDNFLQLHQQTNNGNDDEFTVYVKPEPADNS